METLLGIFPDVPAEALERVLSVCDESVEAASDWLLEHDWRDVFDEQEEEEAGQAEDVPTEATSDANGGRETDGPAQDAGVAVTQPALGPTHDWDQSAMGLGVPALPARRATAVTGSSVAATRGTATMVVSAESNFGHTSHHPYNTSDGPPDQHLHHHHFHHRHQVPHHRHRFDRGFDSAGEDEFDSEEGEGEEDDEDDEDEDDEDDEDGDAHSYYDSGDEADFHGGLPLLTKRARITYNPKSTDSGQETFFVAVDDQVVQKTLIELLNTTLTKYAHRKIMLLNKSSKHISEQDATDRLKSVLLPIESSSPLNETKHVVPVSLGNSLSRILNTSAPSSPTNTPLESTVGQKRKRLDDAGSPRTELPRLGFFAHFFSIGDLDMVWRSMLHAHLFSSRFGELIEFHTATGGCFSHRDFDELMHIQTTSSTSSASRAALVSSAALSGLKCCLLLPCEASEAEIFRVGKHLHNLLKLSGSLYYRPLQVEEESDNNSNQTSVELLNEDGNLTEDAFRRFARYRVKKDDAESAAASSEKHTMGSDHFLAFQRQHKVEYLLQTLTNGTWERRLSG